MRTHPPCHTSPDIVVITRGFSAGQLPRIREVLADAGVEFDICELKTGVFVLRSHKYHSHLLRAALFEAGLDEMLTPVLEQYIVAAVPIGEAGRESFEAIRGILREAGVPWGQSVSHGMVGVVVVGKARADAALSALRRDPRWREEWSVPPAPGGESSPRVPR